MNCNIDQALNTPSHTVQETPPPRRVYFIIVQYRCASLPFLHPTFRRTQVPRAGNGENASNIPNILILPLVTFRHKCGQNRSCLDKIRIGINTKHLPSPACPEISDARYPRSGCCSPLRTLCERSKRLSSARFKRSSIASVRRSRIRPRQRSISGLT